MDRSRHSRKRQKSSRDRHDMRSPSLDHSSHGTSTYREERRRARNARSHGYDRKYKWLMWDPNKIMFSQLKVHQQFIHGIVKSGSDTVQFAFTAVYGLHPIANRSDLWNNLRELEEQMTIPWLLMGDFNAIKDMEDRMNGTKVQMNEIKDFREFMMECQMTELVTVGRGFTWTNNYVYSRIDRGIVNAKWMLEMAPIQVQENDSRRRPFKFYNCLAEHEEFEKVVQNGWKYKGSNMEGIMQNLKKVKYGLKNLNRQEYTGITKKVQQKREELANVQAQMRQNNQSRDMFEAEKKARKELKNGV
ncbi:PREDICTED: uncharacterized protein LOC109217163 [Nicotiana attenuata]|uniref:uncharacterized protein LOC109217163 n=1 Tax=Nicotiana attenuata TaxID=49451 RepID=UPI000905969C|nr:PREDICTED: uncharacterized protein LOC109217163 [Nicotiana attenuata]